MQLTQSHYIKWIWILIYLDIPAPFVHMYIDITFLSLAGLALSFSLATPPPSYLTPSLDISAHLNLCLLWIQPFTLYLTLSLSPRYFTVASSCHPIMLCVCESTEPWHGRVQHPWGSHAPWYAVDGDDGDTCHRSFRLPFSVKLSLYPSISHTQTIFLLPLSFYIFLRSLLALWCFLIIFLPSFIRLPQLSVTTAKQFFPPAHTSVPHTNPLTLVNKNITLQLFCPAFTSNHPLVPCY